MMSSFNKNRCHKLLSAFISGSLGFAPVSYCQLQSAITLYDKVRSQLKKGPDWGLYPTAENCLLREILQDVVVVHKIFSEKKKKKIQFRSIFAFVLGFPVASDGKEPAYNAGDLRLIPGSGRSPKEWNGYPL